MHQDIFPLFFTTPHFHLMLHKILKQRILYAFSLLKSTLQRPVNLHLFYVVKATAEIKFKLTDCNPANIFALGNWREKFRIPSIINLGNYSSPLKLLHGKRCSSAFTFTVRQKAIFDDLKLAWKIILISCFPVKIVQSSCFFFFFVQHSIILDSMYAKLSYWLFFCSEQRIGDSEQNSHRFQIIVGGRASYLSKWHFAYI